MFAPASQTTRIRGNLTRSSRDASLAREFAGIALTMILPDYRMPDSGASAAASSISAKSPFQRATALSAASSRQLSAKRPLEPLRDYPCGDASSRNRGGSGRWRPGRVRLRGDIPAATIRASSAFSMVWLKIRS